jgi:ribose-phosphate pyrophosphokinase
MKSSLDPKDVRLYSGRSHPDLAQDISKFLRVPLDSVNYKRFSNDNIYLQLCGSVRGRVVYIVQSLTPPVSDHLLELLMMLDIARSAAAREIHAIIPYFSYARSDKKNAPRISITARLIADLLQTAGATQVMTMTLHSPQVHGFFRVPTDPLTARGMFVAHFRDRKYSPDETIVVAPDYGRAGSAARLAAQLHLPSVSAEKKRLSDKEVRINELIVRQLQGFRRVIVYDDEIATGGTMVTLCKILAERGIEDIILVCTHGLFIDNALESIAAIPEVKEIVTTDTVPIHPEKRLPKLAVLSVAPVFGEAIRRNYTRQSIGDLFAFWDSE